MSEGVKSGLIGAAASLIVAIIAYAVVLGEMRADIRQLKERVSELTSSRSSSDGRTPTREDICLRLYDSVDEHMNRGGDQFERSEIYQEIRRMECYNLGSPSADQAADSDVQSPSE